ncbi:unnamed protein product [Didymodactylos carnosus]|uniref:Uncharacterized protein n=2 Tax=Didymodactylos carnosus TaxID=1234261 RepID=A0A816BEF8_9BILA|nr:unnamed protein product [Didymodactylos carnosus]CAF4492250.1 unnamed protein product [Didymodactylos carnosus]
MFIYLDDTIEQKNVLTQKILFIIERLIKKIRQDIYLDKRLGLITQHLLLLHFPKERKLKNEILVELNEKNFQYNRVCDKLKSTTAELRVLKIELDVNMTTYDNLSHQLLVLYRLIYVCNQTNLNIFLTNLTNFTKIRSLDEVDNVDIQQRTL